MHVLGIDAGGTKTVCLLADDRGEVVAQTRASGANLQVMGEFGVEKVLHRVMEETLDDRDIRLDAICLGIAGVDRPRDAQAVNDIMRRIGQKTRTVVVNDALVALVAGAGTIRPVWSSSPEPGRLPTDAIPTGRAARAGGWGYLLGDEGGGFWIGRAALSAVVRQFDQRGPATLLTDLVLKQMQLSTPAEVIHAIYDRGLQRHAIAGLAGVVQRAMEAGDAVAGEILERAATELAAAAASVVTRLGMRGDVFPTVLAGGMFKGIPSLVTSVTTRLAEVAPRSEVRRLEIEPANGAVTLALAAARGRVVIPSYI